MSGDQMVGWEGHWQSWGLEENIHIVKMYNCTCWHSGGVLITDDQRWSGQVAQKLPDIKIWFVSSADSGRCRLGTHMVICNANIAPAYHHQDHHRHHHHHTRTVNAGIWTYRARSDENVENWSNYHLLLRFRLTSGQCQNIIWCQNIFWCNWLKVMLDARVQLGETPVSGFSWWGEATGMWEQRWCSHHHRHHQHQHQHQHQHVHKCWYLSQF